MKYIWLTSAKSGNDFIAPIDKIGAFYIELYQEKETTAIHVDNIKFYVTHTIKEILRRIAISTGTDRNSFVRRDPNEKDIVDITLESGMKFIIVEQNGNTVMRVIDPDMKGNSSSNWVTKNDLENIKTNIDKAAKEFLNV